MLNGGAVYSRQNESAVRLAVYKALEVKTVTQVVNKLGTIAGNEAISPIMITRLVVPTPELEQGIRRSLKAGAFTDEPIDFPDLRQAFALLDQPTIWEIAVTGCLEVMARHLLLKSGLSIREYMRHSMATAAGCKVIGESLGLPKEPLFLIGLYHNIGVPIMAHSYPESYANYLVSLQGSAITLEEAERKEFEFTHEDVGSIFLMAATMPDAAWQAASSHHSNEPSEDLVSCIVRLASNVAHQVGCTLGLANACNALPANLVSHIGLNDSIMTTLAHQMSVAAGRADKIE